MEKSSLRTKRTVEAHHDFESEKSKWPPFRVRACFLRFSAEKFFFLLSIDGQRLGREVVDENRGVC